MAFASQLENVNPFRLATCGAMHPAARRIFGKPFVVTEHNYSGPGRRPRSLYELVRTNSN